MSSMSDIETTGTRIMSSMCDMKPLEITRIMSSMCDMKPLELESCHVCVI